MCLLCALGQFSHGTDTMNSRRLRVKKKQRWISISTFHLGYVINMSLSTVSLYLISYFLEAALNFHKNQEVSTPCPNASISIPWTLSFHSFPSKDVVRQFSEYASEFTDREVYGCQSYRHLSRS